MIVLSVNISVTAFSMQLPNLYQYHWQNETGQLVAIRSDFYRYDGYNANGERVYKLTGTSSIDQVNSGYTKAQVVLDDAVLYPNPYIVLTPKGYTKHYYAGTERLATSIGGGGLGVQDTAWSFIDKPTQDEEEKAKMFYRAYGNRDPFMQQGLLSDTTQTVDIGGDKREELVYRGEAVMLDDISLLNKRDMLYYAIHDNAKINNPEKWVFYYHTDHLGSANWITETNGIPIQYIRYAPFGELLLNETPGGYDERYKFTGKERDMETGYDYFGARYYSYALGGHWLTVDPMSDKYPHITPYAYCNWNPVKFVDPDGNEFINKLASPMQIKKSTSLSETQKSTMIQTNTNLNTNLMKRNAIGIDNVFEVFAHGSPQSVMNKLTRITDANQLNSILCASSPYLNSDNNNSSIFIFYACNTGAGKNSIAQQFSSVKEVAGSIVIAPTGAVSLDNNGMEYVKNGGEWRVFVDGVQVDAISGEKGMMTKYVKENMSDIDSFLKNCRQKILDGN